MNRISIVLLPFLLLSCSQDKKGFEDYVKSLDKLEFPLEFSIYSKMEASKSYDSKLFKKYKHAWTYAPYGVAFQKENIIGIVEYSIADNNLAPFLITYDGQGHKIDSLNILSNVGGGEYGQTIQRAILSEELELSIIDSTFSWELDKNYEIDSTTIEIEVAETFYRIQIDGAIQKIE